MKHLLRGLLALVLAFAAPFASATFHTFQIDQIYSDADGVVQFVVLREAAGFGGQNLLRGHMLTSTHGAATRTFPFMTDLPSSATAGKHVLIATQGFAALGLVAPDYVIPNGFLATDGGTLNYADVDQVTYASLPTDGVHAIDRNDNAVTNVAMNFMGRSVSIRVAAAVDLNQHGLTGSWFQQATSGQGVEVEVFANPASGTGSTFVSWFTYDSVIGGAERQRWYTAQGLVMTGQPTASLTIYQNTGGNFDAPPVTTAQPVGTATLSFDTCTSGQLTYNLTDGTGRSGSMALTRLTQNVTCSTIAPHPTNADFALSGNWFGGAATSGQGLTAEVNPISGAFFAAWYTYMPNGTGVAAAGQRWYTAQGAFSPGMRSIPVTIYETTGGMFDAPTTPAPQTVAVGTGTMVFQSCSAAMLSYNFTGGTSIGKAGTIALSRVGPVPPGCRS